MIIHKALKKLDKKENKAHLQQKWNTMIKEIHQDYNERRIR